VTRVLAPTALPRVKGSAFARREQGVNVGEAEPQYTIVFPRRCAFELSLARHLDTKTIRIRLVSAGKQFNVSSIMLPVLRLGR
jgi:hypothetical protein